MFTHITFTEFIELLGTYETDKMYCRAWKVGQAWIIYYCVSACDWKDPTIPSDGWTLNLSRLNLKKDFKKREKKEKHGLCQNKDLCIQHQSHSKRQTCKRQCLSRRRMIRNVISVIYPVFVYKTVIANCCWSLVRFDEKSLTESFIQYVNATPGLCGVVPRHNSFYSILVRNTMLCHALTEGKFVHQQVRKDTDTNRRRHIFSVYPSLTLLTPTLLLGVICLN